MHALIGLSNGSHDGASIGSVRLAVRLAMTCSMFMLAPLCSAADPVMWPSKGAFPAYPSEEDTRQISVAATATYTDDSNLFRVSDQAPPPVAGTDERGDRYLRGSLALNADLDISRQKILIDANADHYSFDQFSQLDDWLYYGAFNWLWVVGSHLDGKIGYTQSLRYPDFSELQYASDDLVTTQYGHLSLDWQALKWMAVRTLVESSEYDHKDFTRSYLNNRVLAGTLGVFYVGPSHSAIGAQYKVSDGTYPNRETIGPVTVDNQYRETESSVVMSTPFESKMSADLRAGYTQRRHEDVIQRDFDGVTGRLQLRYSPTPKVLIDFAAYREVQPVEDLTASFAVVNGASIGPAWAPTPKWVLQASYVYNERSLDGNPGFVLTDTPPREDRIRAARVAIGYQPNRHVQATLSFEQGSRTSNVVDADYDYNLANLQLSVIL